MSKQSQLFEILSDLEYHCSICINQSVKSGQLAKVAQLLRDSGFTMEQNGKEYGKKIRCENCDRVTLHYRLVSLDKTEDKARVSINKKIIEKMTSLYRRADNFTGSYSINLEIDHRVPPRSSGDNEEVINNDDSESNILKNFQFLSKENNNIKREICKKCQETNKRGVYSGINFFYSGDETYDGSCVGCFLLIQKNGKKA